MTYPAVSFTLTQYSAAISRRQAVIMLPNRGIDYNKPVKTSEEHSKFVERLCDLSADGTTIVGYKLSEICTGTSP